MILSVYCRCMCFLAFSLFHSKHRVIYQQKGRLSEEEARFYAAEVVDALEYIHNMGLIHRDIKVSYLFFSLFSSLLFLSRFLIYIRLL